LAPTVEPDPGANAKDDSTPDDANAGDSGKATPEDAGPAVRAAGKPPQTVVHVEVTARPPEGGVFVRDAVVKLDPANPKGYAVLDWRRGDLAE
jgi:hypothetical protein